MPDAVESGLYKEDISIYYECSKCGKSYSKGDKFCTVDGEKIVSKERRFLSDTTKDILLDIIYSFFDTHSGFQEGEVTESFPYTPIDSIEKRGDGSGYYKNYIFQRKSDGKYFYYTSYDGRLEENTLDETTKVVTTVWDFEKHFS